MQAAEVRHALARLDTFYDTARYAVTGHRVCELVTSEYGVGPLLDHHVNRPAHVVKCLALALERTGLERPESWATAEERRLIEAYVQIRTTYGSTPMTDAEKRARVTRKYVDDGTISDERGSFRPARPARALRRGGRAPATRMRAPAPTPARATTRKSPRRATRGRKKSPET